MRTPTILTPLTVRGLTARNRLWLPPMCMYSVEAHDGVATDSDRAAELVGAHREALSEYFPVSPAKHYLISRAYITDERFRSHYDAQQEGFAQWLADAIAHVARASGVDTDNPVWE